MRPALNRYYLLTQMSLQKSTKQSNHWAVLGLEVCLLEKFIHHRYIWKSFCSLSRTF